MTMTDSIDLTTLTQHFSTHDEVSELRTLFLSVKNELELIKGFLRTHHGPEFATLFGSSIKSGTPHKESEEGMSTLKRKLTGSNGTTEVKTEQIGGSTRTAVVSTKEEHRPKPPPLQRIGNFSSNGTTSSVGRRREGENGGSERVGRFQHNFLSMSTLRNSTTSSSVRNKVNGTDLIPGYSIRNLNVNQRINLEPAPRTRRIGEQFGVSTTVKKVKSIKVSPPPAIDEGDALAYYEELEDESGAAEFTEKDEIYDEVVEEGEDLYDDAEYVEEDDHVDAYDETAQMDDYDISGDGLEIIGSDGSTLGMMLTSQDSGVGSPRSNSRAQVRRVTSGPPPGVSDTDLQKECKICHELVSSYALFNHVINSHYEGDVPTCHICNKTFTYKQGLISHMRYHDAGKYDKACKYCGKKFIRNSDVIIHERRLHTGERPYQCPVPGCSQGFVRRYCLLTHVKTNHGEPYMSQILAAGNKRRKSN